MKQTARIQTLLTFIFISLFYSVSFSQISVVSTTGYAVNIDVRPMAIVPASNNSSH